MNLSVALKNRPLCHGNANKLADTTEWVNREKKGAGCCTKNSNLRMCFVSGLLINAGMLFPCIMEKEEKFTAFDDITISNTIANGIHHPIHIHQKIDNSYSDNAESEYIIVDSVRTNTIIM